MHRVRAAARENASRGWSRSLAPDIEPGRFFEGVDVNRRTTAFVLGAILPFLLLPFAATSVTDPRVLVAAGLTPILIALVLELPWARLPAWTQAVPLLAYFVVVGLLRDASEGSSSIFDPLVALPVVWFAVFGTGRELAASIVAMALALTVPVVVGEPAHRHRPAVPAGGVRGGARLHRRPRRPPHRLSPCDRPPASRGRSSRPPRRPSSRSTRTA